MPELVELILAAKITLPAVEICILLIALSFCLLAEHPRLGLTIAYLGAFRWGWQMLDDFHNRTYLIVYGIFGAIIIFLALFDYIARQRR